MKRSLFVLFAFLAMSVFLTSCASRYIISTNTFVDSEVIPQGFPKGTSFAVIAIQNNNRLFSKEVCQKVEKLLEERGYVIAKTSRAKYSLLIDFSISSSTETVSIPHFVPGQTQTTQGNVYGSYGNYASYNQTTESSGTTVYIPTTYVFFTRKLSISVYDTKLLKESQLDEPIWVGNSISSGQGGDLRTVIDYLLVSAFKHFGKNTGRYIEDALKEGDEAVKKLRESER